MARNPRQRSGSSIIWLSSPSYAIRSIPVSDLPARSSEVVISPTTRSSTPRTTTPFRRCCTPKKCYSDPIYPKLHQSTLRKIDCMSNIFERTVDGSLLTNATWWEKHGGHPRAVVDYVKEHWLWSIVVMFGILLGIGGRLLGLF